MGIFLTQAPKNQLRTADLESLSFKMLMSVTVRASKITRAVRAPHVADERYSFCGYRNQRREEDPVRTNIRV